MIFIDTNILIYTISVIPEEFAKREVAAATIDGSSCVLSVQVLNEFINRATRSNRLGRLTIDQALEMIDTWRRFPIQAIDLGIFDAARDVRRQTNYSWWDCLIIAAAIAQGCDRLVTEDMQHDRIIDGVRIVNPFRDL